MCKYSGWGDSNCLSVAKIGLNIYRLSNVYRKIFGRVHMARMHKLASASPPYERVPNILRYTFNNLFIIYP